MDTLNTAERREGSTTRIQNTIAQATEFVVVSFRQPKSNSGEGWYDYETFTDERDARAAHRDLEKGEYPRARAVCVFASRFGIPIGRVL